MKKCTKCGERKRLGQFPTKKSNKDGLYSQCKACKSEADRVYRINNREKALSYASSYYQENKEKLLAANAKHRAENSEAIKAQRAGYRAKNKKKIKEADARYAIKNSDRIRAYKNGWYVLNKDRLNAKSAEYHRVNAEAIKRGKARYRADNHEKIKVAQATWRASNKEHRTTYTRTRYKSDPVYAATVTIRNRINQAIYRNGYTKTSKTAQILGCGYGEIMVHIERQFKNGMSWGNRGQWHIDHIVPLSSAKTEEEFLSLCHYTNLQPLWAHENLSKGAKMPSDFKPGRV